MTDPGPTRSQADLAEMLEMLLDKGVVINADIAVTVGETELLGVKLRAAIASFETAAEYGLEFPEGTDMERVEAASDRDAIDAESERVSIEASASDDRNEADDADRTNDEGTEERETEESSEESPDAEVEDG
ncbi:gas vesicle protein GvpJ [Halomicrococcus sp. NG-SE-24]|uniref:gas vesicle protein GvpJ n=1 Tax=Halomicrococcus sp. NG-SE-24 TaxID=3436928 RepID=UPI003D9535E1